MRISKDMTANEFNAAYPEGTEVRYHRVLNEEAHVVTKTRSVAWTLGHGAPVVMVEGVTGGVLLEALDIIGEPS